MKRKAKVDTGPAMLVGVHEAKPNKLFSEEQRAIVRFLHYSKPVPCAECGKKRKAHWTMLCEFRVQGLGQFIMIPGKNRLLPMAPVCQSHCLAPAVD